MVGCCCASTDFGLVFVGFRFGSNSGVCGVFVLVVSVRRRGGAAEELIPGRPIDLGGGEDVGDVYLVVPFVKDFWG